MPPVSEWSDEKTLTFINLLSAEPAIWDPRHKQHKLKHKVDSAWARIGERMNIPVEQLKIKKRSLMASFRPLINKKKSSLRSESSADEVYQPTWFAYDAMEQFLGSIYYDAQKTNAEDDSVAPSADEWSNEIVLQFIDLLATEPAIWDPRNKQNKVRNKVHEAWTRIEEAMNIPIEQLKAKKKSLMASFRPLVHKKKTSLRSATAADDIYQPTWFAYEAMEQFLGPIYDVPTNPDVDSENENTQDEDTLNESTRNKNASTSGQKKRRMNLDDAQTDLSNSFQILNNILSNKNHEEDDCDIYAKLLATKLRKYPDDLRQRIMYKIDGLLLDNPFSPSATHWTTTYSSSHSSTPSSTYIIPGSSACTSPENDIPRSPITISMTEDSACWQNSDYLSSLAENTSELQNSINISSQDNDSKSTQGSRRPIF
ncbi:hypothetical protein MSG28_004670 [Choristoneura fumiferana]|uniref:Uncharacterized protein n=1 Tax=Choristoneura fumiferana TaxID=7141 RepID=A0ACC0K7I9_CHOFU|nr:hypothetical protein MSG28_004670 [Choristoneura fumiferana]